MDTSSTRRGFLKTSAAMAAAGWLSTRSHAADATPGPNEAIHLGIIGLGYQGNYNRKQFQAAGARVIALCDVNRERIEATRKDMGDEKVLAYRDFRELLDNKDIDAVVVATPDHWHVLQTVEALKAGKDVYVEKPLSMAIGEGRIAVEAAKKYQRIVQIGTQQHNTEHYQKACEIVRSGELGDITEVKVWDMDYFYPGFGSPPDSDPPAEIDWDLFLGPAPLVRYNPNRYRQHPRFFSTGNGWQTDWGVHHYETVHEAMGVQYPLAGTAMGGRFGFIDDNTEWPDTFSGILEYGPGPVAKRGFLLQYTLRLCCRREQRSHSKIFFGSKASLQLDRSGYQITYEDERTKPQTFRDKACHHQEHFLDCVRTRTPSNCGVEVGHYATNPGHILNLSWKLGRKLTWDGQKEEFPGDAEANALLQQPYRAPWKLEV